MESILYDKELVYHKLGQWISGIDNMLQWNKDIKSVEDFTGSMEGMKTLAANAMILEAIGEGVKKVDELTKGSLFCLQPKIPWHQVKGIRNHIAHGYFDLDAQTIYEVIQNDLQPIREALVALQELL